MDSWLKNAPALAFAKDSSSWLIINDRCESIAWTADRTELAWLFAWILEHGAGDRPKRVVPKALTPRPIGRSTRDSTRVVEALTILENAVLECNLRSIDTPEVREALDLLQPYCDPPWRIKGFRTHLRPDVDSGGARCGAQDEAQQQVLRVCFAGIYANVRWLLISKLDRLVARYSKTKDSAVWTEINRLKAELAKLPPEWNYVHREACRETANAIMLSARL